MPDKNLSGPNVPASSDDSKVAVSGWVRPGLKKGLKDLSRRREAAGQKPHTVSELIATAIAEFLERHEEKVA